MNKSEPIAARSINRQASDLQKANTQAEGEYYNKLYSEAKPADTPEKTLNDAVDYIRSLKQTQLGYANKVQEALDQLLAQRDYYKGVAENEARECNKLEAQRDRLREALKLLLADHIAMSKERVKANRGQGWQLLPVQITAQEALKP